MLPIGAFAGFLEISFIWHVWHFSIQIQICTSVLISYQWNSFLIFFSFVFLLPKLDTLESRASVEILLHARDGVTIVGSKYNCHLLKCTLCTNCYLSIQWNSIHWSNIYKQDWYLLLELHLVDDLLSLHYKVILNLDHFVTTLAYL